MGPRRRAQWSADRADRFHSFSHSLFILRILAHYSRWLFSLTFTHYIFSFTIFTHHSTSPFLLNYHSHSLFFLLRSQFPLTILVPILTHYSHSRFSLAIHTCYSHQLFAFPFSLIILVQHSRSLFSLTILTPYSYSLLSLSRSLFSLILFLVILARHSPFRFSRSVFSLTTLSTLFSLTFLDTLLIHCCR